VNTLLICVELGFDGDDENDPENESVIEVMEEDKG